MTFKPHTGDFFVLEGLRHEGGSIPIAIGGDQRELAELALQLGEKYGKVFFAFAVVYVQGTLALLDAELGKQTQTHPAPNSRN